ncbi:MAG: iron ABC transporter permease [Candidatus Bathyarchaeota archaeon]|nr:iron ABC transporter permease [Candidatus Bathyarchaeum sp.]
MSASAGTIKKQYSKFVKRKTLFLLLGIFFLFLIIVFAICAGSADLSFIDVFFALIGKFIPSIQTPQFNESVLWDLRLPRIIMAVVSGIGLAVSGTQMQGITRNPLVSPFTLGISSAAALGASLTIMFGIGFVGTGTLLIIGNAFALAMTSTLIVFALSKIKGSTPETLILAGTALSYFFSALTSIVHFFATEESLMVMVHWTFGSFTGITWTEVGIVTLVVAVCLPIFLKQSWNLNAMVSLGDDTAKGLGVNTSQVRTISMICSALITATIISFSGIIGFVGLVAPHITRYLVGGDHRFLIPGSCVIGAILMLGADTIGRTIMSPIIIPIGIVVSFLGVPLFLYLMLKRKKDYWRK